MRTTVDGVAVSGNLTQIGTSRYIEAVGGGTGKISVRW
jgi:hypothetical protein